MVTGLLLSKIYPQLQIGWRAFVWLDKVNLLIQSMRAHQPFTQE